MQMIARRWILRDAAIAVLAALALLGVAAPCLAAPSSDCARFADSWSRLQGWNDQTENRRFLTHVPASCKSLRAAIQNTLPRRSADASTSSAAPPPSSSAKPGRKTTPSRPVDFEDAAAWTSAQKADTEAAYVAYMRSHPYGVYYGTAAAALAAPYRVSLCNRTAKPLIFAQITTPDLRRGREIGGWESIAAGVCSEIISQVAEVGVYAEGLHTWSGENTTNGEVHCISRGGFRISMNQACPRDDGEVAFWMYSPTQKHSSIDFK